MDKIAPLVKINLDSAEQIKTLYDVGKETAEEIVRYRDEKGPFKSFEDLGAVVGKKHATFLAPHIDWSVKAATPGVQRRNWLGAAIAAISSILVFFRYIIVYYWGLIKYPSSIREFIKQFSGMGLLGSGSYFLCNLTLTGLWIVFGCYCLSLRSDSKRHISKILGVLLYIFVMFAILTVIGVWASGEDAGGISTRAHPSYIWVLIFCKVAAMVLALVFLEGGIRRDKMRNNRTAALSYEFALATIGSCDVLTSLAIRNELLTVGSLAAIALGLGLCIIGVYSVLTVFRLNQGSIYTYCVNVLRYHSETNDENRVDWLGWLNARLPDTAEQRALARALNSAYSNRFARSTPGLLLITVGGFVVLNSISGVVQWYSVNGWQHIIKALGWG